MKCRCCNNRITIDPVSNDFVNILTIKHGIETGVELTIDDAERLVAKIQSEIQRIKEHNRSEIIENC